MKHKSVLLCTILAALAMLLSGASAYQAGPERPEPPPEGDVGAAASEPAAPELNLDLIGPAKLSRSRLAPAAGAPHSPSAVTPGTPGLSFRYLRTIGTTGVPYDTGVGGDDYLNGPEGIFIDGANRLYVAEGEGARVLRYNSFQHADLILGVAGSLDLGPNQFNWPEDVFADGSGDIWVVHDARLTRYDSAGNLELDFPADPTWDCDPLMDLFCGPYGIAFDSFGRLYISDMDYHAVQVFTLSGGTPVYSTTIGVLGDDGIDNGHFFFPAHIAIDGGDNLYVADSENHRLQKCTYSGGWSCSTFHGVTGDEGDEDDHLSVPYGLAVKGTTLYIADTGNGRVKSCNINTAVCDSDFITGLEWPVDVATNSSGDVFVAQGANAYIVSHYTSGGDFQEIYAGADQTPYIPDPDMIYGPYSLGVDSSGNVYANERRGNRYLKYDSTGALVGSIGVPGISLNLPTHFSAALMGNPGVSAAGLLYLPDSNRNCVKIYNTSFVYQNQTIGTCGQSGDSDVLFNRVGGVAVSPLNGNIYVVDRDNNKVKIYTSALGYLGPLGQGQGSLGKGNGDYQFDYPIGIAVDRLGNIYVADRENQRVQKYNSSGVFQYRLGITDDCDWYFDTLCSPTGVSTDGLNRVYIAETGNARIQVYDSTGAYLTTIGGSRGALNKDLRSPSGVAVARDGKVYVADYNNQRIQVFDPGVPFWSQVNLNGFTDPDNSLIGALEPFGGYLYAGTYNTTTGAQLWRKSPTTAWSAVNQNGLGNTANLIIDDLVEYKTYLYASTGNESDGGEIQRSQYGTSWSLVTQSAGGFGDSDNVEVYNLTVFTDTLFATTASYTSAHGAEVWSSTNGTSWVQIEDNGFGDANNSSIVATAAFNDYLYLGTYNPNGAEVWRCHDCDGADWEDVTDWGTVVIPQTGVIAMESILGYLYAQTNSDESSGGAEIFRCHACDGTDWIKVVTNGMGSATRDGGGALHSFDGWLYWAIRNQSGSGLEVWRTQNGTNWTQIGFGGFGDANNAFMNYDQAVTVFNDGLYFATRNWANGGEIWQFQDRNIFLPLLKR